MHAPPDPPAGPRPSGHRSALFAAALTLGVALLVLLVVWADGRELIRTVREIDPWILGVPILLTLLSYVAMSRSYQGIADAAECRLPFRDWLRITLVSNTANYLVTSAGLSGFAVRMYLLRQQGVVSNRAVLISLVQTFLTNITLLFFIVLGFAAVVLRGTLGRPALVAATVLVLLFAGSLGWAVVLTFHRQLRRRTLFFVADAGHRILRRIGPRWTPGRVRLWRFQHNLNASFEFLFARKGRILAPTGWILIDWVLTLAILWSGFWAIGHPISPQLVVIGFAVGILVSLVSLVPGGLGVMEGTMAVVFVGLGVPREKAVVAALIFRFAYYVVPLVMSLFLFHGLMMRTAHDVGDADRTPFDTPAPPSL